MNPLISIEYYTHKRVKERTWINPIYIFAIVERGYYDGYGWSVEGGLTIVMNDTKTSYGLTENSTQEMRDRLKQIENPTPLKPVQREGIDLINNMNAQDWASEFLRVNNGRMIGGDIVDQACLESWFANSIMAGWDNADVSAETKK